jgi:hypothetical protein
MTRTPPDAVARDVDRALSVAVGMATPYTLDAASEVAGEAGRPVMLIASRRQVECSSAGGGYVGWTTEQWCTRARSAPAGRLILARDHGGPYQHPGDDGGAELAMAAARRSLRCDIESGVRLLHIDTSLGPGGRAESLAIALTRVVALVANCVEVAGGLGRRVGFELGLEVQAEHVADPDRYGDQVRPAVEQIRTTCGVTPVFVVAQTGTKVVECENVGRLVSAGPASEERRRLAGLAVAARRLGGRLKAHNCDYLPAPAIEALHRVGAWMNISPEVGVAQTAAIVRSLQAARLPTILDEFCDQVIQAGYWRKWTRTAVDVPDGRKVMLGGSYLFSAPIFAEVRGRLDRALGRHGRSTRRIAIDAAKAVVWRYLRT